MGVVYMAEQTEPVERRVALKIIKPGMDTRQVIARFEAEEQALAMMDHPNIAKVLDAGATDSGRPYFVMELVKGIPITTYCDQQHLTPKERLQLFIPVCQAVQHAHQKGIIHRDLKPTNILVALYDGQPVPKVIDFGVAKATGARLTEKTMFTQYGQVVGTLEYMSPEQANLNQLDVDTRSDIYSLGVLLYELLTGCTPFDRQRLRSAAFDEMMRIIREEEPPKPSTRLSTIDTLPSVAANRKIEPKKLSALVRGELDWIVMKALEKDRARRYETATGFANDIQRYLNDEAVVACPPSRTYRFRKFARRNKAALATSAVVAAALLLGLVGTSWQMLRATMAEQLAQSRYEESGRLSGAANRKRARPSSARARPNKEAEKARTEAAIAQAVNDFVNDDLLGRADPAQRAEPETSRCGKCSTRPPRRLRQRFADQPLVEAAIRYTIGTAYNSLGEYDDAARHLQRARQIRREQSGEDHVATINAELSLLWVAHHRAEYQQVRSRLQPLLKRCERVFGEDSATTVWAMWQLSDIERHLAHFEEAEQLGTKALDIRRQVLGEEHPHTLKSMSNVAKVYSAQGRYEEAETLYVKTLNILRQTLGEEHPNTLVSMNNLAGLYKAQGRYEKAESLCLKTLEIQRRVLGVEHPHTLFSVNGLAVLYEARGRHEDAEALLRETLDALSRLLGEKHPATLTVMNNLAAIYETHADYPEAEALYLKTLDVRRQVLGEGHPDTLNCMNNLACLYFAQRRYEEAKPLFQKALDIRRQVLGEKHPDTLSSMNNLGALCFAQRCYEEAEPLYLKTLEIQRQVLGEKHPDTLVSMNNLAHSYKAQGDYEKAEPIYLETLEIVRPLGEDHPTTLTVMNNLASLYFAQGDYKKAEPLFLKTLENRRRASGETHPTTLSVMNNVARLYKAQGRYEEAKRLFQEILKTEPTSKSSWLMLLDIELALGASVESTQELVANAETALEGPAALELLCQLAAWNLSSNHRGEYQKICREVAARYADSTEARTLCLVARAAALTDQPVVDTKQLVKMASRAVQGAPTPWGQHTLGLCLLRDGQELPAIEQFNQSLGQNWLGVPLNWLGLAIAHSAAGRDTEAQEWLGKAQEWFEENPLDLTSNLSPGNRIACQLLLREAEQLIERKSSTEDDATEKVP